MIERETEREEFDYKLDELKHKLKERERESLDTEDLRSHVLYLYLFKFVFIFIIIIFKTEQVVTEAEEKCLQLENRRIKTEECLNASKLEVQTLKSIIQTMENRIDNLVKNDISQKNSINQLTDMIEEEQNNQQDMLTEVSLIYLFNVLFIV